MSLDVRGVFPPIPTTFDDSGNVDLDRFAANIDRWNRFGLAGYVVLGSNGEFPLLDTDEKLRIVERARRAAAPGKLILAGTGAESTRATIALTRAAAEAGADAALVLTPAYFNIGPAAMAAHFQAVADTSPIPILVYNMPLYAKVDLTASAIIDLARHPNIVGYKESAPSIVKIAEVVAGAPSFAVLAGSANYLYPAICVGAVGGILGMANVAPAECVELFEAACAGDHARARSLHDRLLAPNAAITSQFGIAGMKAGVDLTGGHGGPPRPPLQRLSEADRSTLAGILDRAGIRRF